MKRDEENQFFCRNVQKNENVYKKWKEKSKKQIIKRHKKCKSILSFL